MIAQIGSIYLLCTEAEDLSSKERANSNPDPNPNHKHSSPFLLGKGKGVDVSSISLNKNLKRSLLVDPIKRQLMAVCFMTKEVGN